MRKFDYSFLRDGLLPVSVADLKTNIALLNQMAGLRKDEYQKVFTELEHVAKVQSVKSSNAIEGIVTSDERIAAIVNGNSAPLNHTESEIAGYRDALNLIHTNFAQMDFCERDILKLHQMMMLPTNNQDAGHYKTVDNYIIEEDAQGARKVRFEPTAAADTAFAMEQLVLAYLAARNEAGVHPLLLIPCVILDFLCIHPFRDGNGRLSRLLSLLLLYKSGYDAGKYISFEEQINHHKSFYYQSLKESSEKWHENGNNYFPFMLNFLSNLYLCYKELDKRFVVVHGKKVNKSTRVEAAVMNSLLPISKAEICQLVPDVSPTTVEAVLAKMVKAKQVLKIGTTRNVRYTPA